MHAKWRRNQENGHVTWQWVGKMARMTGHFCQCQLNGTPDPRATHTTMASSNGFSSDFPLSSRLWTPQNLNGVKADEFVSPHHPSTHTHTHTHTENEIRKTSAKVKVRMPGKSWTNSIDNNEVKASELRPFCGCGWWRGPLEEIRGT